MGHTFSSIFFVIIIVELLLNKTKLNNKINLIKLHKILGSILVFYLIGYSVIDFFIDKDPLILLIIPSLIGIFYTGVNKYNLKFRYLHSLFVIIFLATLLTHVLF